jgi:hypothetical protein
MNQQRRTGRTTKAMQSMFSTKSNLCIFVSKTHLQSKYHAKMLCDLIEATSPSIEYTYNPYEGKIVVHGKEILFISYEYYIGPCFGKGLRDYEVFKDHLVYGIE